MLRGLIIGDQSRFHHATDLLHCGSFLGEHFADAFDLGADGAELFFDVLVAAVDVVDAVDDGLAIGDESG